MIYIQHIQDLVGYMQAQIALEHKSKRQATVIKHTHTHTKNFILTDISCFVHSRKSNNPKKANAVHSRNSVVFQ